MSAEQKIQSSEAIIRKYGKSFTGKTILITGVASDSIAGELALQISTAGPRLLILSARTESRVGPVVNKIKEKSPDVAIRFLKMDLSDLYDVRKAAASLDDLQSIDSIAAVAGVMMPPYSKTVDGIETQFGVNYVANFLLIKLLLPKIEAAGPSSSIIIVASSAVRQGRVNFDDVGYSDGDTYDATQAYGQSNVARVMFTKRLAERLSAKGLRVHSIDPGYVKSGLQRSLSPELVAWVERIRATGERLHDLDGEPYDLPELTSASQGAATIITAMVDPTIEGHSGAFLHNNAIAENELHTHIRDEDNWIRLWNLTEKMIGESFDP